MNPSHAEAGDVESLIENQLEILDSELQKRYEERSTLLQQINIANSPCGRDFPLEILSLIFEYTCSPIDLSDPARALRPRVGFHLGQSNTELNGPYLPIVLGSVSSGWRHVAQATPCIWTTVVIEVSARTAESHASLLQLYLQNSQARCCNVELDFQREQQDRLSPDHDATEIERRVEVALQPIARILFHRDNATKFGFLRLIAVPFSWLPRLSDIPPQTALSLDWPTLFYSGIPSGLSPLPLNSSVFPSLQTLHINNFPYCAFQHTFATLIRLDLANLPLSTCLDALSYCINLEECRSTNLRSSAIDEARPTPIVLTGLHLLEWMSEYPPPRLRLPPMLPLRTPALTRLKWDMYSHYPGSLPQMFDFFRHLPRCTTTLHLTGSVVQNLGEERLPCLFTVVPQIQHLYLEELNERSRLIPIIQALGQSSWTDSIEDVELSILPFQNLHTISFILSNESLHAQSNECLEFINNLFGMIWMRSETIHDARLRIELNVELDWPDGKDMMTEVAIGGVAHNGLVLDILEKGQTVEWVNLAKAKVEEVWIS